MLKKTLTLVLTLAALTTADISFTDEPLMIDDGPDSDKGVYLPNTGCRAMAEFQSGEHQGDVMVVDLHSKEGDILVGSSVYFNIWDSQDEWEWDTFQFTNQPGGFLWDKRWGTDPKNYSQLANASIYSSNDGVIHLGNWRGQMFHVYSRYIDGGSGYAWIGFTIEGDGDDSYWSASYYGGPVQQSNAKRRFGQVLQPTFYVNEYWPTPMTPSIEPTFVLNGHDCERTPVKAGFYFQTLTDPTYEGRWNDPMVITPQTFGNMGFSNVTGDGTGNKLHVFWESSINTGLPNPAWHSAGIAICQNELYYTNVTNGLVGQITRLTDNYADSGGTSYVGCNIISSDVDPAGNVWALYEIVTAESPQFGILNISIGIVKLSSMGSVLYGPEVLRQSTVSYNYTSPQIHIDEEGIAHLVYIRKDRSIVINDQELWYANFNTNTQFPIILTDLTEVSGDKNYHLGVGHIFVDSERRIHFVWMNREGDGSSKPKIYYLRSEDFCARSAELKRNATSVSAAALKPEPIEFNVEGTFPNPASERVTFSYSLPKAERVTIKVYDLAGRLVAVPVDEVQSVGHHTFEWNVEEQTGLVNGLYLYTLRAGENVQTKRLVISR
jgi:hypothetical protein